MAHEMLPNHDPEARRRLNAMFEALKQDLESLGYRLDISNPLGVHCGEQRHIYVLRGGAVDREGQGLDWPHIAIPIYGDGLTELEDLFD